MKRLLPHADLISTLLLGVPAILLSISSQRGNSFALFRQMGVLLWPGANFVYLLLGSQPYVVSYIVMVAVNLLFWFAVALAVLWLAAKYRAPANG